MTSILLILLAGIAGILIFRQFSKDSFLRTSFSKLNSQPGTLTIRLIYYVILVVLSVATPYIVTVIFIILTGDRIDGMRLGVIPGIALVHLLFGFLFIKRRMVQRLFLTFTLTLLAFGVVWLGLTNEIIRTNWDFYGYWDLALTNFLAGLLIWETYFQINLRLT